MPNAVHHRGGITHAVRYLGWEWHAKVSALAALPPNVSQKLLGMEWLLDRNILNEQSQHPLAVFGGCGGSMPYTRQIPGQRQHLSLLFGAGDASLLTQKFHGLFLEVLHLQQGVVPAPFQCGRHQTLG